MLRTQSGVTRNGEIVDAVREISKTIPMFENTWAITHVAAHKINCITSFNTYINFDEYCSKYLPKISQYADEIGAAFDAKIVNGWKIEVDFEIM